ncbi:MAG: hypothetical protein A2X08_11525 [Bacteroidetes bacterium GWA2_32_17]|nr:MAG: hypothetical protein A2X08_11525 [Bacteroidetes bacterium GWA2_32_17]
MLSVVEASAQVWKPLSPLLYATSEPAEVYTLKVYNNKLLIYGNIMRIGNYMLPQPQFGSWGRPLTWDGIVYDSIPGLGNFYGVIYSFAEFNNKLYCGGNFNKINNDIGVGNIPNTKYIARFDGTNMEALSNITPSNDVKILKTKNYLYVAGYFYFLGSTVYGPVAGYNGTNYSHLGVGVQGTNPAVYAMTEYNNEIIISGGIDWVGGLYTNGIAAWSGTVWHKLKDEYLVTPNNMVVDTINNFLYVSSQEYGTDTTSGLKRWDGYNWDDLHIPDTNSYPFKLCMYHKELFASLLVVELNQDTILLRYDGVSWYNIIGLNSDVRDMCVYNDDLYIAGYFNMAGADSVNGIVALHVEPPTGCNWLIPRVFANSDTFYLGGGNANVQLYNNNAYAQSWQWNFGDSGTDNVKDPIHSYTIAGNYTAIVTVTDSGCVKTAQKTITILNGNGLEEYTKEKLNFKVYPNPTTGNITVECTIPGKDKSELRAFSSYGSLQEAYSLQPGYNKVEIPAGKWDSGVSIVGLYVNGKQILAEKVVKN